MRAPSGAANVSVPGFSQNGGGRAGDECNEGRERGFSGARQRGTRSQAHDTGYPMVDLGPQTIEADWMQVTRLEASMGVIRALLISCFGWRVRDEFVSLPQSPDGLCPPGRFSSVENAKSDGL